MKTSVTGKLNTNKRSVGFPVTSSWHELHHQLPMNFFCWRDRTFLSILSWRSLQQRSGSWWEEMSIHQEAIILFSLCDYRFLMDISSGVFVTTMVSQEQTEETIVIASRPQSSCNKVLMRSDHGLDCQPCLLHIKSFVADSQETVYDHFSNTRTLFTSNTSLTRDDLMNAQD